MTISIFIGKSGEILLLQGLGYFFYVLDWGHNELLLYGLFRIGVMNITINQYSAAKLQYFIL